MKAVKLKFSTHMDNGLMYRVYQNPGQGLITLDMFYNLPLMKNFHHTFLKNCKGYKVETCYTHGQWIDVFCIPEQGPMARKSGSLIP